MIRRNYLDSIVDVTPVAARHDGEYLLEFLERRLGWPADHQPLGCEARAVARAIPGSFGLVPANDAAHVRAHRTYLHDVAAIRAMDGDPLSAQREHFAAPARDILHTRAVVWSQPIGDEVERIVDVLLDESLE